MKQTSRSLDMTALRSFRRAPSEDPAGGGGLDFAPVLDLPDARAQPRLDLLFEALLVVFQLERLDGLAGGVERDVVAGDRRGVRALGDEVVEQALVAGVRAVGVAVVDARERVLEDRGRPPGRADAAAVAALLDEVQLGLQDFKA